MSVWLYQCRVPNRIAIYSKYRNYYLYLTNERQYSGYLAPPIVWLHSVGWYYFNGRVFRDIIVEQFTCPQVRCWISGRVTLAYVGVLNWIWKADCQELPLSLRDPICVHVGFLNRITINTFEKMSKISKMFKVSSSSSSSSRPTSSSGSSSRSKHRSRSGPSPQEAINRLRETEAMLTKKQEYLESRIEQELTIAKKNGTKNKRGVYNWYFCFYEHFWPCGLYIVREFCHFHLFIPLKVHGSVWNKIDDSFVMIRSIFCVSW